MRIFIGIPLNKKMRSALRSEVQKIKPLIHKGKFSSWEGYHITLRFLGDISEAQMVDLILKLEDTHLRTLPFEVCFTTLGVFKKSKGDILWLGVSENAHLQALKEEVDTLVVSVGFEPEARAFVPHLTLGRGIRYTQDFEKMQSHWSFKRHCVPVDRIVLFESVQVEGKLSYVPLMYLLIGQPKKSHPKT